VIKCMYEETPADSHACWYNQPSAVVTGDARRVGTDAGRFDLTIEVPLEEDLDLREAHVTLARLVREVGGRGTGVRFQRRGRAAAHPQGAVWG
jgi:hypothetical protein